MDYDGILFCGADGPESDLYYVRGLGPYRLRTVMAERGYRIKLIDFCESYTRREMIQLVRQYVGRNTKFLAVSTTFMMAELFHRILHPEILAEAEVAAGSRLQIISGGARALLYKNPAVDWYVSGYADDSFPALADFITGKSLQIKFTDLDGIKHIDSNHSYPYKDTANLSTMWLPEDVIKPHEALPIEIARGCIFRCSFCAFPLNGKKKLDYIRDPENLLSEIRRNRELFGVTQYGFMDDTYNDSEFKMSLMHKALTSLEFKVRFTAFIKPELLNTWPHHTELLAESGLMGAGMGFESFHYKTRQAIRKGPNVEGILRTVEKLHRDSQNSIGVEGTFIAGLPYETMESLLSTHEWLKKNTDLIQVASWRRLYISKKIAGIYLSDIDKNPESFGYTVSDKPGADDLRWRSGDLSSDFCFLLQNQFMNEMATRSKWGGWNLPTFSHFDFLDIPKLVSSRVTYEGVVDHRRIAESRRRFMREYFETQMSGKFNQPEISSMRPHAHLT